MNPATAPAQRRQTAMDQLALDVAAAEVVGALRAVGIRAILLKGPALGRRLYSDTAERPYGDIDLLVEGRHFGAAEAVLVELGYETPAFYSVEVARHARCWVRRGTWPAVIDLHRALFWSAHDPDGVWSILSSETDELDVGGLTVETPGPARAALLLALHAASDGPANSKALADLGRGLERLAEPVWREAAVLAGRLDALEPFAAGVRLRPEGRAMAQRLGLSAASSVEVRLRSGSPPPTAIGLERLRTAPSTAWRVRSLVGELVPSPSSMRVWQPLASRGRLGLLIAYLWRPVWLAWKLPAGALAWSRTRRGART